MPEFSLWSDDDACAPPFPQARPPRVPPARRRLTPDQRRNDRVAYILLTVVQVVVSMFTATAELLNEMGFDACGERGPKSVCDYSIADSLYQIELTTIAVTAAATIAWALIRSLRGQRIWWLPLVATGAALAVSIVLILTVYKMINLPPFDA